MHAMMALYDSDLKDEVFTILELAKIKNYTQFTNLHGSSAQGKKEGSVAWPGANEILLLILSEGEKSVLLEELNHYKQNRETKPPLLVFDWKLSEVL
jgi:hypothetical protein